MAYYAAILNMLDADRNLEVRPKHIQYLDDLAAKGKVFARGPFGDGSGGLVIYQADNYEEALRLAKNDPHVVEKVRSLELKEWII